jgi:hypothetical protein
MEGFSGRPLPTFRHTVFRLSLLLDERHHFDVSGCLGWVKAAHLSVEKLFAGGITQTVIVRASITDESIGLAVDSVAMMPTN